MVTLTTAEDLRRVIETALDAAGERACHVRYSRWLKTWKYLPHASGYRFHISPDLERDTSAWYYAVGEARHRVTVVNRYAKALEAAGLPVRVAHPYFRRSRLFAWVLLPFDRDDRLIQPVEVARVG